MGKKTGKVANRDLGVFTKERGKKFPGQEKERGGGDVKHTKEGGGVEDQ